MPPATSGLPLLPQLGVEFGAHASRHHLYFFVIKRAEKVKLQIVRPETGCRISQDGDTPGRRGCHQTSQCS